MLKKNIDRPILLDPFVMDPTVVANPPALLFETEMISLYRSLQGLLTDVDQKIIMFLGANGGEGVSTVVTNLARVVATIFGLHILVVDADTQNPSQHKQFGVDLTVEMEDVTCGVESFQSAIQRTKEREICIMPLISVGKNSTHVIDAKEMEILFNSLRSHFDLILVDCAPTALFPDSVIISRYSSGVVLIIEAESTRSPVAETLCKQISKAGGNVIGIIFNKRRFYIPEFVYRRL